MNSTKKKYCVISAVYSWSCGAQFLPVSNTVHIKCMNQHQDVCFSCFVCAEQWTIGTDEQTWQKYYTYTPYYCSEFSNNFNFSYTFIIHSIFLKFRNSCWYVLPFWSFWQKKNQQPMTKIYRVLARTRSAYIFIVLVPSAYTCMCSTHCTILNEINTFSVSLGGNCLNKYSD